MNTQSSEPLTLNPAFVYVEHEKENRYHITINMVIENIESLLLRNFRESPDKLTTQYIEALKDIRNMLVNMGNINNKWYQEEDERNEVYKYLCNFETHLDPERHKRPQNLADVACYNGPRKPDNY